MEWEICLPVSEFCRWEEEMTMDLFPRWPARMLRRTQWSQTERLAARGSLLQSEIGTALMDGLDCGLGTPFSSRFQRRSSLVGPSLDAGSPPKTCWLHDKKKCSFSVWVSSMVCGFHKLHLIAASSPRPSAWASQQTCVFREGRGARELTGAHRRFSVDLKSW